MNSIWYIFIYIFEAAISYMYFSNKFELKAKKRTVLLSFSASVALQYAINLLGIPYVNLISFVLFNLLLCYICFNSKLIQALFSSAILAAIMLITELMVVYISKILLHIEITEHMNNNAILLIQSSSAKLLYFLVAYLISKVSTKENLNDFKMSKSYFLLLLPIASMIFMHGITYIAESYEINNSLYVMFTVFTILIMYSNIIIFQVHESLIKSQKEITELQLQTQKAEIDTTYYSLLQNQYENSNILIHDIKRHLMSIKDLAADGNCTAIDKYIDNLYKEYEIKNIKKYSAHKLVNAIINRYAKAFQDNNIDFFCDIRDIDFSFISDNDLTAVLDNLLENALEASKKSDNKKVELLIYKTNVNYIAINLSNYCCDAPVIINGKPVSTKKSSPAHGFGIKSIERILNKYNGNISFSYDKIKKELSAKLVMEAN